MHQRQHTRVASKNPRRKPDRAGEQILYDHLLNCACSEQPEQLIERFRTLFVEGIGYPDPGIPQSLDTIIASKSAEAEFQFVLNRCCHIVINRWQSRSQLQMAIPELVGLFSAAPSTSPAAASSRSRSVRRLRQLVRVFTETEQYLTLQRLAQVVSASVEDFGQAGNQPLGTLIRRYPYIYQHCLLSEDSSQEHKTTIRRIQRQAQKQFEVDLSQYITNQVRQAHRQAKRPPQSNRPQQVKELEIKNPTLLTNRELATSVKHFAGRVHGNSTYQDLAQRFTVHSQHVRSYKAFKDDLYEYITAAVDPAYGNRRFNQLLQQQLAAAYPDSDAQPLNDFLMVRTCNQLLNFLVVDGPQKPEHFVFIDLINNLGPVSTTGLLLKIILLCNRVKPVLEKRFSILFNHYEAHTQDVVLWLVKMLENLNVALSLNFGGMDLSFIR